MLVDAETRHRDPVVVASEPGPPAATAPRPRRDFRGVVVAVMTLLVVYGALSLLVDPKGSLGSDTGAKVATIETMSERDTFVPDIGYWAERFDPDGSLHPMYDTARVGDHWVDVTTLPMLLVAKPFHDLGGMRAVLALPMLGAVLSALAARALARRGGAGDGWWGFWGIALATPVAIYALDFWEHTLGVAAMAWATVFVVDVVADRAGTRGALASGALFGLAATMRTEALVYALVAAAVVGGTGWRAWRSDLGRRLARTGGLAAGVVTVLVANDLLERGILGASLRSGRASATAGGAGGGLAKRAEEAITTMVGLTRFSGATEWLLGAVLVVGLALAARSLAQGSGPRTRRTAVVALGIVACIYGVRFGTGLGFVPGMLTASPLAVAGVALWQRASPARWMLALAVAALPLVWLFQYSGGAGPQWGGRYVLVSSTLLAVGGVVALRGANRVALAAFVAAGVLVSACGVAWLSARSHAVADAMEQIDGRPDDLLVSREQFLLREGGAFYEPSSRWLTVTDDRELREAFRIAERNGADQVGVVQDVEKSRPRAIAGYERVATEQVDFFPSTPVIVATYRRA